MTQHINPEDFIIDESNAHFRRHTALCVGHPEWANLPSTRADALAAGSDMYFTGKLCKRNHVAPRITSDYCCLDCALGKPDEEKQAALEQEERERIMWQRIDAFAAEYMFARTLEHMRGLIGTQSCAHSTLNVARAALKSRV